MDRLNAVVIALLLIIIGVLSWLLLTRPEELPNVETQPAPVQAAAAPAPAHVDSAQPLSARVKVASPLKGASVAKTFTVKGEAPGPWFFEGSFPVMVQDKDGNKIGQVAAQAEGEWMTEGQVPFTAKIVISSTYKGSATLVLLRDNPSGMPENDDAVSFEIVIE